MSARFAPGDPVVHAIHGSGTVVSVEHRDTPDGPVEYVAMEVDNLTILIPTSELEDSDSVREPIGADAARALLDLLGEGSLKDPGHAARRRRNAKRLTEGDAEALAKVVRSLHALQADSDKPLRLADVQHLRKATGMLVAELAVALQVDQEEAEALVAEAVAAQTRDPSAAGDTEETTAAAGPEQS